MRKPLLTLLENVRMPEVLPWSSNQPSPALSATLSSEEDRQRDPAEDRQTHE
jgi:hypothetical protein